MVTARVAADSRNHANRNPPRARDLGCSRTANATRTSSNQFHANSPGDRARATRPARLRRATYLRQAHRQLARGRINFRRWQTAQRQSHQRQKVGVGLYVARYSKAGTADEFLDLVAVQLLERFDTQRTRKSRPIASDFLLASGQSPPTFFSRAANRRSSREGPAALPPIYHVRNRAGRPATLVDTLSSVVRPLPRLPRARQSFYSAEWLAATVRNRWRWGCACRDFALPKRVDLPLHFRFVVNVDG